MGTHGKQGHKNIDKPLRTRELAFLNAHLDGAGVCDAARIAGYSEKGLQVAAHRIMNKPNAIKYLEKQKLLIAAKRRELTEVDDIWITEKFKAILDRCMQARPVMKFDRERGELVPVIDEESGEPLFSFDSAGAIKAAENLAKHIGYYELDNKQKQPVINIIPVQNNIIQFFEEDDEKALLDGYKDPDAESAGHTD